jgi:hypothetical protein
VDDQEGRAGLAQWSRDARRRGRKLHLHAILKKHDAKNRFRNTERMERAAEEYQRAILSGVQRRDATMTATPRR